MKTASWEQIKTLLDSISKAIKKVFVSTENAQKTADKATAAAKDASQSAKKVKDALEAFNIQNGEAVGSIKTSNAAPNATDYILGENAIAFGENAKAAAGCLALGNNTTAESYDSVAIGTYAQANVGIAIGTSSQASRSGVALRGAATGEGSIAIGGMAKATGEKACAIGFDITAAGKNSTVIGRKNGIDTENKYVFIVGNGYSTAFENARTNAHTLDWDGNAWYAGTVEGTAMILKSPNGTRYKVTVDDSGNLTAAKL